jgi:glucuronoarabinoxylan endo-1,4-beta-xylanase
MKKVLLSLGVLAIANLATAQVTITIDKTMQYQKIEGFGGLAQESYDWGPTKVMSDGFANDMVNDLGATIFRHIMDGSIEPVNDNNDPNNTDFSKFTTGLTSDACVGGSMALDVMSVTFKKLRKIVEVNGEKAQFYATVFTPPAWMKYNNCAFGTDGDWNRMATNEEEANKGGTNGADGLGGPKDFKDEFAEFCYAYLQIMKNNGVNMDVLSVQNEPAFPEPYSSCVYIAKSYAATFKTAGKYIRNKGFNTRMMFTEDISDRGRYLDFVSLITADPESSKFADIAAIHSYAANAVSPGSSDAKTWTLLNKVSRINNADRSFWQTETSGYTNDYSGAISVSTAIFTALKYGKVNAWMFHGLSHPTAVEGLVINNGEKTDRYYACKHYFKYIRPGAISVDAASSEESILSVAFQHNDKKTLTVVLTNVGATEQTVSLKTLQTTGVPTMYKMYLTSSSAVRCTDKGNIMSNASIKIPANGIVTLVGENSQIEQPTATDGMQLQVQSLVVSPNPSNDYFTITSFNGQPMAVQLLNPQGILVKSFNIEANAKDYFVSTADLSSGMYILKSGNTFTKVLVQK